ncbi:MAG: hypothetical protein GF364_06830 [Candidatus Lokiarchaeota archaeon]|nr:hypothetical protein [Candidatus Lokiarchaeota archaeon]
MLFEKYDLFKENKYFNQCHAPYIIEMPNRDLFVSFFAGSHEKAKDVGSWVISKNINDEYWSKPRLFLKTETRSMGGGHFFIPPNKQEIWLFFNLMHGRGWSTCNTARYIYDKAGWHKRDYLRKMIGWNTRGKILVLDNGDYLMPMHDEILGYKAYFLISKDSGKHWKAYGPIKTKKGCLEPTVIQLSNGLLYCLLRTKEREIYEVWSKDRGRSWTKPMTTEIPNPDSMIELLYLNESNTIILAYNHSNDKRSPLNVRISQDNAHSWSEPSTLEEGEGEYSYPCMILGSDENIHLVYTSRRKTIGYIKFDRDWLFKK